MNRKNNRKEFRPNYTKSFDQMIKAEKENLQIKDITKDRVSDRVSLIGIVDRIVQTSGPTLFGITDGTGTFTLKGFEGKGARAFAEVNERDVISVIVQINEFNESLEGEIIKLQKLEKSAAEDIIKKIEQAEREKAKPKTIEFLAKSPILDKLKDRFIKAATEIRLAVLQNRPIIVRHHNDTDGYSSGFALEKAIVPLIEAQHGPGKAAWEYYTRAPCAAPFYEIDDSIRDTAHSLTHVAKFSNKMPLVIISDNGSSPEDLLAIQQGKVHGMDFIVVDHHFFDEDVISAETLVHINPFLVGEDGAKFSAGMLCTELGRFINPDQNSEFIAGMAGLADRIDNPPVMEAYMKIAEKNGYNKQLLVDISSVIDFVSAKLRFMEAREYIEVLFGEPHVKQKELVALLAPYITKLENKAVSIAKTAAKSEKVGEVTVQTLMIEETFSRGLYPKPGKVNGMIHDLLQKEKNLDKVVSLGVLSDAITMRATDKSNFSVHELIKYIEKKLPEAFVEGGGHKNAGAIKFVPTKQQEVVKLIKEFIKNQ